MEWFQLESFVSFRYSCNRSTVTRWKLCCMTLLNEHLHHSLLLFMLYAHYPEPLHDPVRNTSHGQPDAGPVWLNEHVWAGKRLSQLHRDACSVSVTLSTDISVSSITELVSTTWILGKKYTTGKGTGEIVISWCFRQQSCLVWSPIF
jgi:hypothetical protein